MFCKLFNFAIFKAQLDDVQGFKVFNVFSVLGFLPSAGVLTATVLFIIKDPNTYDQTFMAYIDVLILVTISIILAILDTCKG